MSPTLFKWNAYRFFFFSREERRPHVHASCQDGVVEFWLEPTVAIARSHGLSGAQLTDLKEIVERQEK